jgi:23S rRNA pseudouridine2605 synthase
MPPRSRPPPTTEVPDGIRLQKLLASAGIGSRRASEELIRRGLVTVDGRPAELGQRVDPSRAVVQVEGRRIALDPDKHYYAFNKPAGVVTTMRDPEGRTTIADVIGLSERVLPVGRLDVATEGLILLTNDGELSHRLAHPSFGVPRTYLAEVAGRPGRSALRRLTEGVPIGEGETVRADAATLVDTLPPSADLKGGRSLIEVTVHEGRKHVVRRMLAAGGMPVIRLVRTHFGPLRLDKLAPGSYRRLTQAEVAALYRAVGL